MLLAEFIKSGTRVLSNLYPEEEARSMVMCYCTEVFGFPVYQHITEPSTEIPPDLLDKAMEDMARLGMSEPLQYVLGCTECCGRRFAVDERALIPRAETEMLCQIAQQLVKSSVAEEATPLGSSSSGLTPPPLRGGSPASVPRVARPSGGTPSALRILDLCTGSGCIAWTLALNLPGAEVVATDLSEDALALAESQFSSRRPELDWSGRLPKKVAAPRFVKADVLNVAATVAALGANPDGSRVRCNLLTANPPYVMVSEKAEMRRNVLAWEPHMAIFAPDEDPLAFHKAIASIARLVLAPGGRGIVEINSELPEETAAVFTSAGLRDVKINPDFFERPRFISFGV